MFIRHSFVSTVLRGRRGRSVVTAQQHAPTIHEGYNIVAVACFVDAFDREMATR